MSSPIHRLGTAPTVQEVDQWLRNDLGLSAATVGTSLQGRAIVMYTYEHLRPSHRRSQQDDVPMVLFLSLVHGNEPMGLFSLLETAKFLALQAGQKPFLALFVPFVNIDAYTLNLRHGQGCRRTNLRPTCNARWFDGDSERITSCPYLAQDGVDLNRNHPIDWDQRQRGLYSQDNDDVFWKGIDKNNDDDLDEENMNSDWTDTSEIGVCSDNYHGPRPWSEPETRAIRDVVLNNSIAAAISFHSRHDQFEDPLLIHPYTSSRPISKMPVTDAYRFRAWSQALNEDDFYVAGTAEEAIHYTAGGSTIDWMYSANVTAFVVEVVPPCDNRWCPSLGSKRLYSGMERYGCTGRQLIDLVLTGEVSEGSCTRSSGSYFVSYLDRVRLWTIGVVHGLDGEDAAAIILFFGGIILFFGVVILIARKVWYMLMRAPHRVTRLHAGDESESDQGIEMNSLV